jgi:putative endonuclease
MLRLVSNSAARVDIPFPIRIAGPGIVKWMSRARLETGRIGERIAARMLEAEGWRLIARNARPPGGGELDLIALERDTLVFVEIKTQRPGARRGPLEPVHAVDRRKQLQVRRLARAWLAAREAGGAARIGHRGIRFDAIGIRLALPGGEPQVEHLRGAF